MTFGQAFYVLDAQNLLGAKLFAIVRRGDDVGQKAVKCGFAVK